MDIKLDEDGDNEQFREGIADFKGQFRKHTKTSLPCERIPRWLLDRWGRQLSLVDTIIVLQGKIDESNLELCGLLL